MLAMVGITSADDIEARKASSRMAVKAYGKALRGELVAAMDNGGPLNAVGVCNTAAPEIADKVSVENNLMISRTSLKTRNSESAPSDWQEKVLNDFEARKIAGEDVKKMEFAEIAESAEGSEFRYMKAIATGEVCLKCHGSNNSDELTAKLSELYPEDRAVDYSAGDIRGAFVVVQKMQ